MFKIVMLVYVLMAGQPMDAPTAVDLQHSFAGLDKCQAYLTSPAFALDRTRLSRWVTAAVTAKEQAKAKAAEDESIPPVMDTAITASCETDDRI